MTETAATQNLTASNFAAYNIEDAVLERYQAGAQQAQASLCCPTEYDGRYLELLPSEIIEKDYGCGDPSRHVRAGETVVDLGSGGGKICYILSQKVGESGRVIGVDFNDEMLNLARKYQPEMVEKIGHDNVRFVKGKIQDLALDLDRVQTWLKENPIATLEQVTQFELYCDRLRQEQPLVESNTVDVVVSNCVLNLVRPQDKQQLFQELYRVLKRGGRVVISDIVCDEEPTPKMINDPELWSGCLSGAFREDTFLKMFEKAGFYGIEILSRQEEPWQTIDGIEFRSLTIQAFKGKEGECWERNQAVIYKGPWKQVRDDDGHIFERGQRMAVCDKTFQILTQPESPYRKDTIPVLPYEEIPLDAAKTFDCKRSSLRAPTETKGAEYRKTQTNDAPVCGEDSGCC
ncbi:methyltransferase domain-containing protein [Oscillatoriales cyanobacterium LEGE 11467]|uniref:Arsenite methyltransferase n=1 Tax=Zarconia navalis LEGE 11467 TaxID=1828826 RepID=A0A928Z6F4_9CYAN|nr:methyltransferase domain-containing protein [Zarconia navalis]MBE9039430.1 methyltransferase domain-containing protein [Zarconia navalis LEGE 11467]